MPLPPLVVNELQVCNILTSLQKEKKSDTLIKLPASCYSFQFIYPSGSTLGLRLPKFQVLSLELGEEIADIQKSRKKGTIPQDRQGKGRNGT